ncbi:hypothetical protein [Clavibacter nebraskensis]|uniref:hypothetical protein n=1 Tax=Clavibacter nebraskensis TaxID=31963 RepID=UPI003F830C38
MEHETGRIVLPNVAKVLGAVALVSFGTGYWYAAIPCVVVVVLCVLQLRRWTHHELEERARLAESPTEEEQEAAPRWDADGGISLGPRPAEDRAAEDRPDAAR